MSLLAADSCIRFHPFAFFAVWVFWGTQNTRIAAEGG